MVYEWEEDLEPYVSSDKIEELRKNVDDKIRKGLFRKWITISIIIIILSLMITFVGFINVCKLIVDLRIRILLTKQLISKDRSFSSTKTPNLAFVK